MKDTNFIISLNHISKWFGEKQVLNDVNLNVKEGEFITILGPSGCGKTTLLRIIAGFVTPDEGVLEIDSKMMNDIPPYLRPVNTVFQRYALFPHLNVFDNVAFGLKLKKVPQTEIEQRVRKSLKMVDMTDYEWRDVDSLSGGQQQRVAIARALINSPHVLLLDEPLSALDHKMRTDMQMELKAIHKNLAVTFLYVTHDQEEALTLSDRIVVMNDGVIQQIGTPIDIYNEPVNSFVADFIGESNILNGTMVKDKIVNFLGHDFECVDEGFGENIPVDVVIRPEDIYLMQSPNKASMFEGIVKSCIFKGIHYTMTVLTDEGYEIIIQDYNPFEVDTKVSMIIKAQDIQVMHKERLCNEFEATLVDETHLKMLGTTYECEAQSIYQGEDVKVIVEVDFDKLELLDDFEKAEVIGDVRFILYKGDHYHLTVMTEGRVNVYVDTNYVWDERDLVGIKILPKDMRIKFAAE